MHNSGNTFPILSVHFIHKALCLSGKAEVIAPSPCHGVYVWPSKNFRQHLQAGSHIVWQNEPQVM